jgi:hypothetical protein
LSDQGIFSDTLKVSIIKLLFKSRDDTSAANYRPASTLSSSLLLKSSKRSCNEKFAVQKTKILDEFQHGFTIETSTITAVADYVQSTNLCKISATAAA